ncbi:molybdopterin-dependent oxidoreductase [Roseomonas sp. HJA6]|uniref:Molybdopterin-dependent oxidoreductase n=1 Tax=Roseomonas alba TaxID=2846776 RepID=A0ABS7A389_9PROT|nr:molybdopterin-dependent oxidoreductase [Neoroseomonas alba]MBW6396749.1 molybdopterin-dependent oxidoreductase [Neoroseomonas alba]
MRRREILAGATLLVAARPALAQFDPRLPAGTREIARMGALPGKRQLIELTDRPPNFETPLDAFRTPITPNDRFFVRYHLALIPEMDELRDWRVAIGGPGAERSVTLSLADLQRIAPPVTVTAVCQCSGNRRGLFQPHVPGVEWGIGAMGNARWTGVRLRDVLARAGVKSDTIEVAFDGADGPIVPETPDFVKSIPLARAIHSDTLLAWEMNGQPLPHFNGFPLRVVVPGWTATYWMKHVNRIELRTAPEENFWMKAAYRVPRGLFPTDMDFPTQMTQANEPITQIMVNSLVTNLQDGVRVPVGGFDIEGIAWDGGHGIRSVEVSTDRGETWQRARLGQDLGVYAFRPWTMRVQPGRAGPVQAMVRATSNAGQVQAARLVPNPAGYHHNVIQTLEVIAS